MDEAANTIGQFVTKYMRKVTERCFITLEPLRRYNAFTHVDAATGKRFTYDPFALYHTLNKKKMPFTCPVTRQPLPRSEIIALCALINKLCIDHKQKGPGFSLLNRFDAFVALNTFGECILMVDKVDWSPDVMHSTELSQTIRNMCLRSLGIILNQVQGVGIEAADIVQSHIDTFTNNVRLWGALVMTGTVMASEVAHFTAMMWQNFTVSVASLQMLGSNSVLFRSIMHVMAIASRTMSAAPYFKLLPIVSVQELRDRKSVV